MMMLVMVLMLMRMILMLIMMVPESQKPRWQVGIADRNFFARPESFCAHLQNYQ